MNSNDKLDPQVQNHEDPRDGIDLLDDLCFAIEARAAGQSGSHHIAELKAAIIRLMYRDDPGPILHPPVEGELAEVYEDSTGARFIHQTRNEQLPPAGTKLYAAPAPKEPAEAVGTLTVRRYRGSDAMVNHDFDLHATLPDGSYQLYLRQTGPAPATSEPDEAVGYLDIGAGGYIDIGSDLTDAQLSAMPKGRHMLGIIGTYGVDGYTRPQTELAQARQAVERG